MGTTESNGHGHGHGHGHERPARTPLSSLSLFSSSLVCSPVSYRCCLAHGARLHPPLFVCSVSTSASASVSACCSLSSRLYVGGWLVRVHVRVVVFCPVSSACFSVRLHPSLPDRVNRLSRAHLAVHCTSSRTYTRTFAPSLDQWDGWGSSMHGWHSSVAGLVHCT